MEMIFINVGYGDAILVQNQGFTLLLDGGSSLPEEFEGFEHRIPAAEYLKAQKIDQIDLLVISHIHEDHVCGLEAILEQIPVKEIRLPFDPAFFEHTKEMQPDETAPRSAHLFSKALNVIGRLVQKAKEDSIPLKQLQCGDKLELPGDLNLSVLAPARKDCERFEYLLREVYSMDDPTEALVEMDRTSNATSLLIDLACDGVHCLLAADNVPANWSEVDFSLLKNESVLKLPHHGQKDSFSEFFMKEMPLQYVVTTASSDRRYNSANQEVYENLLKLHPQLNLLFIDEREYPPYFSQPEGFQAIKLRISSGNIFPEFISLSK